MSKPKLKQLAEYGQSVWLDYIDRPLIETGKLNLMINNGLRGMTSNPSIFNQAIGQSNHYDEEIIALKRQHKSTFEIYDALTIKDIQAAADVFKPVYEQSKGLDGYVSLEINPLLANKVDEQIKEGKRLFEKVSRPNCMIKVPSTDEGFAVIEELIASGINVNVTLIFSLEQYEKTVQAYWKGLTRLAQNGGNLRQIRSVASVFVSRIDTLVDAKLEALIQSETNADKKEILKSLLGKAAVANCRNVFEKFRHLFASDAFNTLRQQNANIQRVLWGSTGTKNSAYSDVKYIEELIVQPTVNTLPEKTINAFIDHGEVKDGFTNDARDAQKTIDTLRDFGIDIDAVCRQLLSEGCVAFDKAFETLLESITKKADSLVHVR